MKRFLLALESWITALPFITSWMLCAVFLSIKAGYQMAKADAADKATIIEKLWPSRGLKELWQKLIKRKAGP